jgi:hypothetical protein
MDDQQLPPSSRPAPIHTPPPGPVSTPLPVSVSAPSSPRGDTAPPLSRTAPPSSKPPSSVETTIAGEEAPFRLPRTQGRTFAVVIVCFLVGALGMGGFAYKTGLIGGHAHDSADYAAQATDAAAHQQWDAVLDLTDKGLARSPRDPHLLELRARASTEAVTAAKAKAAAGDTAGAVRLAKVATQLDPDDGEASALVATLAEPPAPAPIEQGIPALASGRGGTGTAGAAMRAIVDVSSAKPGVGQPVDMAAHIQGNARTKVEGASFHIVGPGIAPGTHLDAADDGSGVFRATFTFLQSGRFEVSFTARADGAQVRSVRAIIVGDVKPLPAPGGPSSASPLPAPTDSAKWL